MRKIQNASRNNEIVLPDSLKVQEAIDIAVEFGGIGGEHHKNWVIDQIVRILAGKNYHEIVKNACDGDEGPNTYKWEIGIAP